MIEHTMSRNKKIHLVIYANALLSALAVSYVTFNQSWSQVNLMAIYVIYLVLAGMGAGLFLHRFLTHRSFKMHLYLERVLAILSVYCSVGSPTTWVATHRCHHAFPDDSRDPHSPNTPQGRWSWSKIWQMWHGWDAEKKHISLTFARDVLRSDFYSFLHHYYFYILLVPTLISYALWPLQTMLYYSLPAFLTYCALQLTNILGHGHGYRNFECKDRSTNSWIVNIFTLGDGWHNNHHANPVRWNNQHRWWEFDIIALVIRLIKI